MRFGAARRARGGRRPTAATDAHELSVGFQPGRAQAHAASTASPVERAARRARARPLVSVFLPDRLELDQGRRRRCAARTSTRSSPRCGRRARRRAARYSQALAQRNALLGRIRAGARGPRRAADAWDVELARHGIALRDDRAARGRAAAPSASRDSPPSSASPATASCATARARRRPTPQALAAELRRARGRATSSAASRPRPAPRRPRARRARGATCAPTARRASSGSACWRCCWPSATALEAERGRAAADAARRRDERARRRSPRAAGRRGCATAGQSVVTTTDLAHVPGAEGADVDAHRDRRRSGPRRRWRREAPPRPAARRRRGRGARRRARARHALAAVQRAWPDGGGRGRSQPRRTPSAERDGVVTVACASSVWAQELTLMGPRARGASERVAGSRDRCASCASARPRAGAWARTPSP